LIRIFILIRICDLPGTGSHESGTHSVRYAIFPLTIVATTFPVNCQPSNGVLCDNDRDLAASNVQRFLALRDTAFTDPRSYFNRYAVLSDEEATATAIAIWERTNLANLEDNILPTRPRATLILKKGADHLVETVALRRL